MYGLHRAIQVIPGLFPEMNFWWKYHLLFPAAARFLLMATMEIIHFVLVTLFSPNDPFLQLPSYLLLTHFFLQSASWYLSASSPEGLLDSCGFPFGDLTVPFFTDCGANCHKQCRDLLVLACRKFSRGTSVGSNHGSLPSSPSLPPGESTSVPVLNQFWNPSNGQCPCWHF